MASSKAHLFPKDLFKQAFYDKCFSHPARRIILEYLHDHGTTSFRVIRKQIMLSTPTVSQHFKFLKILGVITGEDVYPTTYYSICPRHKKIIGKKLNQIRILFPSKPPEINTKVKNP